MTTGKPIITHFLFKDTNDVSGGDRRVIKNSSCHFARRQQTMPVPIVWSCALCSWEWGVSSHCWLNFTTKYRPGNVTGPNLMPYWKAYRVINIGRLMERMQWVTDNEEHPVLVLKCRVVGIIISCLWFSDNKYQWCGWHSYLLAGLVKYNYNFSTHPENCLETCSQSDKTKTSVWKLLWQRPLNCHAIKVFWKENCCPGC